MKKLALAAAVAAAAALAACAAHAQTTTQFPTTPWGGFAPGKIECGRLIGANMNSTADQAIPISFPSATYQIDSIDISNASISLTTAVGGFYPSASKGGTAIVANSQAYSTLTAAAVNAAGSTMTATLAVTTAAWNLRTIYFSLTTPQGAAATADIRIYCRPLF